MVIGLIAAALGLFGASYFVGTQIGEMTKGVPQAVGETFGAVMGVPKAVGESLTALVGVGETFAKGTTDIIQSAVDAAMATAEAVSGTAEAVSGTVEQVGKTISATAGGVSSAVTQGFQNIAEVPTAITGAIGEIPGAISSKVTEPVTKIITYPTEFIAAKETEAGLPGGAGLLIIGGLGLGAAYLLFKKKGKAS